MCSSSCRRSFVVAVTAALSLSAVSVAIAQQSSQPPALGAHDGVYAVDIFTQHGGCDKVYHWTITVLGGHISSAADSFMKASGEITASGNVSIAFRRDNHVAAVGGQVREKTGWGTWSSSTLQCAGTWSAVRRDNPSRAPTLTAMGP